MTVGGNVASDKAGCLTSGFNHLLEPNVKNHQKPGDERDYMMIEEPVSDILAAARGDLIVGTGHDLNLERMEEHQSPMDRGHATSVDNGAEVPHTRDSFGTGHNMVNNIALQPSIIGHNTMYSEHGEDNQPSVIDQNTTEPEHGEANQNVLVGNARVSSIDKGKIAVNTDSKSTLIGRKRDSHDVQVPSIMDRNPTAQTMAVIIYCTLPPKFWRFI